MPHTDYTQLSINASVELFSTGAVSFAPVKPDAIRTNFTVKKRLRGKVITVPANGTLRYSPFVDGYTTVNFFDIFVLTAGASLKVESYTTAPPAIPAVDPGHGMLLVPPSSQEHAFSYVMGRTHTVDFRNTSNQPVEACISFYQQ